VGDDVRCGDVGHVTHFVKEARVVGVRAEKETPPDGAFENAIG
jgi:hypothetical protein